MASPFVKVDLSKDSRDFEKVVIHAGVPLLDPHGSSVQILRKWLKGLVAAPEIKGNLVEYYVLSDDGGRLENVRCTTVNEADLDKLLLKEFDRLTATLQNASSTSQDEKAVLEVALKELLSLSTQQKKPQRPCYFFKYQDSQKNWRLVWCVGYRRKDTDPSLPQIGRQKDCQHLSVQRTHDSNCPVCGKVLELAERENTTNGKNHSRLPIGWFKVLASLVLLAVGLGLGLGWRQLFNVVPNVAKVPEREPALIVTPATWSGPVDGRIEFTVKRVGSSGETDVSREAVVVVSDPRILTFDEFGLQASARSLGKAVVHFQVGTLSQDATVSVQPFMPDKLWLEPAELILGVGTTAQLKLIGESKDQVKVDLTDAAEWTPAGEKVVYAYRGLLEGLREGEVTVRAGYRVTRESNPIEATVTVSVRPKKYQSLTLRLDPLSINAGQVAQITAEVKPDEGLPLAVSESSLLSLTLEPKDAGSIQGRRVYAVKPGMLKIKGTFQSLEDTIDLEVKTPLPEPDDGKSDSQPRTLELAVGEVASLAVKGKNSDTPVRVVSSLPNIVQVLDDRRLVGRAEGNTRVEVIQGTEIVGVEITVKNKPPRAIAFAPSAVAVRVDDAVSLRVVAELDSQKTFDVAPDVLEWIGMPRPDYASLDKAGLRVRGLKTTGDDRETLVVRFGGREARAVLEVLSAPLRLELAPSGPLKIPAGQKLPLKLWATYGDGNRQEIASDRVEWTWTPVPGLSLDSGALQAEKAGVGPVTLIAAYQGTPSNEVEVRTTPAEPLKLKLTAKPERLAKGKTGLIEVAASTDSGPVTLREQLLTFESSNPDSLQVTPGTGQFRAEVDGVATITAKASTGETATVEITVGEQPEVEQPKTKSVRIVSVQPLPVKVPVGVEFTDFRIEAVSAEGAARDVTEETPPILAFTGMAEEAPLVLREGKLLAVRSGAIQLTASFDGVTAEKPLEISVVEELQVDEIRISLAAVRLAVGESTELVAEGFVKGKSVGILTSHPRITWKSRSGEGVLKVNGSQVTALNAGESGVTAQLDEVVSAVTAVTVVEDAKDISVPLQVSPATLTLRAEDSRVVGTGIKVTRSGVDFATQVQVTPADLEVVVYDPELRRLTAVAPGRTLVAYAAGGQLVQQTVVVTEAEIPTPDSRVEIEPNGGTLAVGERLNLRGLQVCGKCKSPRAGRTSSMALTSSDPAVCAVDGVSIVGLKTGKVLISARLPGVDAAATATFVVVDTKFDRLVIVPPAINLSLGGQSHFNVYGLTASGRRLLGDHPGLTLTLEGPEASSVELNAAVRSVSAVAPGRAQLVARWSDSSNAQLAQIQIPVNVKGDQVRAIRLVPEDGSIPEGQTQIYQVFVQRGANWLPLAISDGVTLRSSKNNVARVKDSLQADALEVEAVKAGVVLVTAHYSNRRAEARLTVVPPDPIPNTPNNSPGAPSGRPVGLQFIPNLFRLEMGTPGDSIRVVRVYSDGRQEDVDHLATVTVRDPQDVITIEPTTSGPVVRPKRIGQTQLDATLGGLRTESPLLIDVVAAGEQRTARLRVHPNPMRLQKGETGVIGVVEVVPARGGRPFSPNYKLSASPSPVIVADDGRKSIRGLTAGNAVATVTVLDPGGGYDGLSTNIPVEVIDPAAPPPLPAPSSVDLINPELQLSGPDETTVGAEVQLQVERVHGDSGVVVNSEAQLSLPAAEQEFAKFAPGCKLVALKPGTVHLQARFEGLVSKVHELKVGPPHPRGYERLKLEVEEKPLSVGDIRDYKLWGYPQGGGPREDLTNQVRLDNTDPFPPHLELTVLKPSAEATVVTHKPPRLIAAAPGQVQLQASVGSLKSNPVELSVSSIEPDEMGKQLIQIRIEPPKTVIREGEKTPQFRVLVRSRGSSTFREVDNAKLESLDSALLTMTADDARRFTAVKAGETRVQATFGEKSDTAEIKIVPDRFREVVDRNLEIRKQNFLLQLDVAASASAQKVEYRIIVPETREHSDWKPAEPKGGQMTVSLKTPLMVLGPNSQTYRLHLEARDVGSNAVERYPFSFQIKNSATVERKN